MPATPSMASADRRATSKSTWRASRSPIMVRRLSRPTIRPAGHRRSRWAARCYRITTPPGAESTRPPCLASAIIRSPVRPARDLPAASLRNRFPVHIGLCGTLAAEADHELNCSTECWPPVAWNHACRNKNIPAWLGAAAGWEANRLLTMHADGRPGQNRQRVEPALARLRRRPIGHIVLEARVAFVLPGGRRRRVRTAVLTGRCTFGGRGLERVSGG